MARVTFHPGGVSVDVDPGSTVLLAARLAGVMVEAPCNGSGTCGKCKVYIDRDDFGAVRASDGAALPSVDEDRLLEVLACQTTVLGDLSVRLREDRETGLRIVDHGFARETDLAPAFRKEYSPEESSTRVYHSERAVLEEAGDTRDRLLGAVVDIGTTTLVVSLIDLTSGDEIGSVSRLNPQSLHAQDVLSRIKLASNADGLRLMQRILSAEVDAMLSAIVREAGRSRRDVYEIVLSGNTCMLHLMAGADPGPLGRYPYDPVIRGGESLPADDVGLRISAVGRAYLPPIIAPYVGADITSGILASGLHTRPGTTLFVDVGTNGEVVLNVDGRLIATSTAAGPAFEGMNITHGMRASDGAIEGFRIHGDGAVEIETIGGGIPSGICGSGLIDIVSELVANGVIGKSGRFVEASKSRLPGALSERLFVKDGKRAFRISDAVYVTQDDIRQVQLAKGAVRAGIEVLLKRGGVTAGDVGEALVAGSFGYHLREESLIGVGLLPREFGGKVAFLGNTSKSGGRVFLLDSRSRDLMSETVLEVGAVELGDEPDFDRTFVRSLCFDARTGS